MSRYAVIDVGTNSVKFHIAEPAGDGSWHTVVARAEMTRLGEGLDDSGRLEPEPIRRTADAIAGMVEEAQQNGIEGIAADLRLDSRPAPDKLEMGRAACRERG